MQKRVESIKNLEAARTGPTHTTHRDRERVMRTLERTDTPIPTGMQIYHNYVRSHMALKGRTPAEAAGIKIEGENKWLTLIQNASRKSGSNKTL